VSAPAHLSWDGPHAVFIEDPTSKMTPQTGLRMACVPAGLSRTMWGQWKTHIDITDTELALKIVVDHLQHLTTST